MNNVEMEFTNLTDWSWALSDFAQANITNNLTLGNKYVYNKTDMSTFQIDLPHPYMSQNTSMMTFGIDYQDVLNTVYFANLTNGTQPNVSFSTVEPGIVLSHDLFVTFAELVDSVAGSSVYTIENKTHIMLSDGGCSYYNDTLMQYSFRFNVLNAEDQYNVTVPLAAFAVDRSDLICELFVTPSNFTVSGGTFENNVQFGTMFFQSFWGMSQTSEAMALRVNEYSNDTMFAGAIANNTNQTEGKNPFIVYPTVLPNDQFTTKGMQTFTASVTGISDSDQFYYIDFLNSDTVVWGQDCNNTVNNTLCTDAPLYMNASYVNTTTSRGTFSEMRFTGYEVSGDLYYGNVCFEDDCTTVDLFVGREINSDALMYDIKGAYGILGLGPYSPLWAQLLEPESTSINYSVKIGAYILLEDQPFATSATTTDYWSTEISFAEPLPEYFTDYPYIWLESNMTDQKYQYQAFEFGKITYGSNPQAVNHYEDAESESFEDIGPQYSDSDSDDDSFFMMDPNIQGLLLDEDTWEDFTEYLVDACNMLDLSCSCSDDAGGYCMIFDNCENSVVYELLLFYQFKLTVDVAGNHLDVPLGAFAQNHMNKTECKLIVQTSDDSPVPVILGGMFFQNYFGYFTNQFSNDTV